ncbi:MAG: hypothetical protein K6G81_01810 [Lachnospiraceae bacterium]|nr:hypothetical protein [Lachnospiraceae bacterium]
MVSVQPAVKKETRNVAVITAIGVVLMLVVFLVLHLVFPDGVPFNYTVVLAGVLAGVVAVINFFMMGLAVQKVAAAADEDEAKRLMQKSYYSRFGLQVLWMVAVIAAPCFNVVAGLIPLIFPGFGIRMRGVLAHMFPKLAPIVGIGDDVQTEPAGVSGTTGTADTSKISEASEAEVSETSADT